MEFGRELWNVSKDVYPFDFRHFHRSDMTSSVGMLMGCVVALLSVLFAFLQVSPGEMPFDPPESMITFSDTPQQLHSNRDGYTFGRFRSAVSDPNLREMNLLESTLQRKEWAFTAVSNGRFLVGMATADLGYVETGFLYFFDIHTGAHDSWQFLLPGVVNGKICFISERANDITLINITSRGQDCSL